MDVEVFLSFFLVRMRCNSLHVLTHLLVSQRCRFCTSRWRADPVEIAPVLQQTRGQNLAVVSSP